MPRVADAPAAKPAAAPQTISLRGVRVHNLKNIDLDLPRRKLIAVCGPSGSGKTSLALDTLYAEGQRRYLDTFSPYVRQFLAQIDKPDADRIDGIPPAIAVRRKNISRSNRSTVATTTEIASYVQLLFARLGTTFCTGCGEPVRQDTAQSAAHAVAQLPEGTRAMITFPLLLSTPSEPRGTLAHLREQGFVRVIFGDKLFDISSDASCGELVLSVEQAAAQPLLHVVVDRLTAGQTAESRLRDSLELALASGEGRAGIWSAEPIIAADAACTLDDRTWHYHALSRHLQCERCGIDYPTPEPQLFSFHSPLGACPTCEGYGSLAEIDMNLVVPNPQLSLRAGAIAPWNTPAYAHELEELLALADDYKLPVDVPFIELTAEQVKLIEQGVPERNFGGLRGFFNWLDRRKYKMHLRVYLSRWKSFSSCPDCGGTRLQPAALATQLAGKNIGQVYALSVAEAHQFFSTLPLEDWQRPLARTMLDQLIARLGYLRQVGLDYLSLDRTVRTLSGGEASRVTFTAALGSSLVNMLYVIDEPSAGLHPRDIERLVPALRTLRDRGNTVVLVEHDGTLLTSADWLVELGPGAGLRGGEIVFAGPQAEMLTDERSLTGEFLAGKHNWHTVTERRAAERGWIKLTGASGHNLKNLSLEFPLGVLCLVTGVSGAGKTSLVKDTLYPALVRRLRKQTIPHLPYDDILGTGQLDDVQLVDQSPIGKSPRSNPVTYIKAFDEIRTMFAETMDARTRNIDASKFSFNVDGGRCTACQGDGYQQIDMQFLADVLMKCPECHGQRYKPEILAIKYRGRSIAEVLNLTVREAFTFFRGRPKLQAKLKRLIDVGLEYLQLGQPANTLSGGESQRLKLAQQLTSSRKGRTLFLLDEPTTGLHFQDVVTLLDCLNALLAVGHSLIVIDQNVRLMQAADYLIDLGPEAGDAGGYVVAQGTPEEVAANPNSITGRYLQL